MTHITLTEAINNENLNLLYFMNSFAHELMNEKIAKILNISFETSDYIANKRNNTSLI